MTRILPCLSMIAAVACGCAKDPRSHAHDPSAKTPHDSHGHGGLNLIPATEPCPGPTGPIHVRVLDSPELGPDDPVAFMREPEIHWMVALDVVEVVEGEFSGDRLGVLVHSPSMFASHVWGFGASPQEHPAKLELRWTEEFCLFEVVGVETPEPELEPDAPFEFEAPQVHSGIVG